MSQDKKPGRPGECRPYYPETGAFHLHRFLEGRYFGILAAQRLGKYAEGVIADGVVKAAR